MVLLLVMAPHSPPFLVLRAGRRLTTVRYKFPVSVLWNYLIDYEPRLPLLRLTLVESSPTGLGMLLFSRRGLVNMWEASSVIALVQVGSSADRVRCLPQALLVLVGHRGRSPPLVVCTVRALFTSGLITV